MHSGLKVVGDGDNRRVGLVVGLSLVLYGNGIAADYIDQGGGGLAVLSGWAIAGMGYLILAGVILWAGITSLVAVIFYRGRGTKTDNEDEHEPEPAGDAERAAESDQTPKP